jgi:hypothetical protein
VVSRADSEKERAAISVLKHSNSSADCSLPHKPGDAAANYENFNSSASSSNRNNDHHQTRQTLHKPPSAVSPAGVTSSSSNSIGRSAAGQPATHPKQTSPVPANNSSLNRQRIVEHSSQPVTCSPYVQRDSSQTTRNIIKVSTNLDEKFPNKNRVDRDLFQNVIFQIRNGGNSLYFLLTILCLIQQITAFLCNFK